MAEHDEAGVIGVELSEMVRHRLHRDQRRARDMANGVLSRFPNIDHTQRLSCFEQGADFSGSYFNWQFTHRPKV